MLIAQTLTLVVININKHLITYYLTLTNELMNNAFFKDPIAY